MMVVIFMLFWATILSSCSKEEELPSRTPTGLQAVDLGLPSGIKWANMNVGAYSPEECGAYFAWGEIAPKSHYGWSNYKWCEGTPSSISKYCTYPETGIVDNKISLDLNDDIAHVKWGGKWRMPTRTEIEELCENCTWKWIMLRGVKGFEVVSRVNGNFIFLPAAGYYGENGICEAASQGCYWSSTLLTTNPSYAYNLGYDLILAKHYVSSRDCGFPIRPVCE